MSRENILISLFIFALIYFIRSPYFSIIHLNWDEWTFILMGQDVLDGNLPYTNLWDIKPPLTFWLYAVFLKLFGNSLEGIRLGGMLFVFLSILIFYFIQVRIVGKETALISAILTVVLMSYLPLFQATMTEHLVLLPVAVSLWFMVNREKNDFYLMGAGFFVASACLIRMNMAYLALVLGLYLFMIALWNERSLYNVVRKCLLYGVGFLLGCFILLTPYWLSGNLSVFIDSVINASLSYAHSQRGILDVLTRQVSKGFLYWEYAYVLVFLGLFILLLGSQKIKDKETLRLIIVYFMAIQFSMLAGGRDYYQYQIQIFSFVSLFIVSLYHIPLNKLWHDDQSAAAGLRKTLFALLFAVSVFHVYLVADVSKEFKTDGEQVALLDLKESLSELVEPDDKVVMLKYHVMYWMLRMKPHHASLTHPNNIMKSYLLAYIPGAKQDVFSEVGRLFSGEARFLLTDVSLERDLVLKQIKSVYPELFDQVKAEINDKYETVMVNEFYRLYRLKPGERMKGI